MKVKSPAALFNSTEFARKFHYKGTDLGATYFAQSTNFRLWAPTARHVDLLLFQTGHKVETPRKLSMKRDVNGTWVINVAGDLKGQYFRYRLVHTQHENPVEAVDPYAVAVGANGERAMVVDLPETNPEGWSDDAKPEFSDPTDAIIYEVHVRDFTIHKSAGSRKAGTYLGLSASGTRGKNGMKTGVDHLKELGVTHVHLLPIADFASIDETKKSKQYNWGYDPKNYSVPEGSYASDPFDGRVRVREFKQMVQELHKAGLRVVLDVVYNHTYHGTDSHFNHIVPGYYYRQNTEGGFSNGSGCGNETASDRSMVRKMMIDSLVYWAKEYHVDGFRFDLMGLHDLDTMKMIRKEMDKIDPSILLYGEGWTGGDSPLPYENRAMKTNVRKLDRIAAFNDTIRDAIKGHVAEHRKGGFVQGVIEMEDWLKTGIVASTPHQQIKHRGKDKWHGPWAKEPRHCVSYDSCHDNHTLWDKILITTPKVKEADRIRMYKLAAAIVLTSQGISFIHAGEEILRTKKGHENSYNLPDAINAIDWGRKIKYADVYNYYRGLITLRKVHPAFRMKSTVHIQRNLAFLPMPAKGMVGYCIHGVDAGDSAEWLVVIFNSTSGVQNVELPESGWNVLVDDKTAGSKAIRKFKGSRCSVAPRSALVLAR
jgi:pullulanase